MSRSPFRYSRVACGRCCALIRLRSCAKHSPKTRNVRPVWRGSPAAKVLGKKTFAVVSGTTAESWVTSRLSTLQLDSKTVSVADYRSALQQLRDGKVDGVFGDGAIMLGFMDESSRQDFVLLDRLFTHEPLALAVPRGDEDFRLLVDRTLGQAYGTNGFRYALHEVVR